MELLLKYIFDNNRFYRYGTNKVLFKASNLYGRNVNKKNHQKKTYLDFLEKQIVGIVILKI